MKKVMITYNTLESVTSIPALIARNMLLDQNIPFDEELDFEAVSGNIIIEDPFIINCLEGNFVTNNYIDLLEWIIVQKRKEDAIIL